MATDLTIVLDDLPGELARLGEATGNAGINLEGIAAVTSGGKGEIHILVQDPASARAALETAGISISTEREVAVVSVADEPGAGGSIARRVADAGVNITLCYLATNTRLVLGSDDVEKLKAAL